MIKVKVIVPERSVYYRKNGSFTKGNSYLSRQSKCGGKIVALSNEGYWIPLVDYTRARSGYYEFINQFHIDYSTYYYRNRKQVTQELLED